MLTGKNLYTKKNIDFVELLKPLQLFQLFQPLVAYQNFLPLSCHERAPFPAMSLPF
jgi:hypothetical protein